MSLVEFHCVLSQANEDLTPVWIGATETNFLRDLQKKMFKAGSKIISNIKDWPGGVNCVSSEQALLILMSTVHIH